MIDIEEMLDWRNAELRDVVAAETKQRVVDEGIIAIGHLLDQQLKLCAISALSAGDQMHYYRQEAIDSPELPSPEYSSRVRLRGNSLQCVWYSNVYRKKGSAPLSREIQKGVGIKYHKRSFSKAGEVEAEVIEHVEDKYAQVRDAAVKLRKLRAALAEYERSVRTIFIEDSNVPVEGE